MAEEIAFENGRIFNFEGLATSTLIFDRVILHTVVHHSSTSTHMPNFIEIEVLKKRFVGGQTYGHTHVCTDGRTPDQNITITLCFLLDAYVLLLLVLNFTH